MYSETDLEAAVAGGVLTAEQAAAFRGFVASGRHMPAADEEHFRLLTGFNDIFVGIAATILLLAVGWIGQYAGPKIEHEGPSFLGPLFVAATAWGLAEFFTLKRRMALPSIILLLSFAGGIFFATQCATTDLMSVPEYEEFGARYDRQALDAAGASRFTMLHIHGENIMFEQLMTYPVHAINWHDRRTAPSQRSPDHSARGAPSAGGPRGRRSSARSTTPSPRSS